MAFPEVDQYIEVISDDFRPRVEAVSLLKRTEHSTRRKAEAACAGCAYRSDTYVGSPVLDKDNKPKFGAACAGFDETTIIANLTVVHIAHPKGPVTEVTVTPCGFDIKQLSDMLPKQSKRKAGKSLQLVKKQAS